MLSPGPNLPKLAVLALMTALILPPLPAAANIAPEQLAAVRTLSRALLGKVSTLAGGVLKGYIDHHGNTAAFNSPKGVAMRSDGMVVVADSSNHAIRGINPQQEVQTIAGIDHHMHDGIKEVAPGFADGRMGAARFNRPTGITADRFGNLYVADSANHAIRKITLDGVTSTLAGGHAGDRDGKLDQAEFNDPKSVTLDSQGNLYVADAGNHCVRKITPDGMDSTLTGSTLGFEDGVGEAAKFPRPEGIDVDGAGIVYVADTGNNRIRKILPNGRVTTIAGSGWGMINGPVARAQFATPSDVSIDRNNTLYVADSGNNAIRIISAAGIVSTLAGTHAADDQNAKGGTARFANPTGINVDTDGRLYVADTGNNSIRRIE
ncbi:MAG: hypothetical protein H7338_18685 [Candidatus Sericytochromatia bacterium]|nr:hypothetical protein [Candidatus Sericytochromatia bacterium]